MEKSVASLKLFKITKILILILIIPALILGIFSGVMMFKAKANGGFPSMFGIAALQINNDKFYNELTGEYSKGSYYGFSAKEENEYALGDFVAYYVGELIEEPVEIISKEPYPFEENIATNTLSFNGDYDKNLIKSNSPFITSSDFSANNDVLTITDKEKEYNNGAEVKFGIITNRYIGYDAEKNRYTCFTIYDCSETYDPNRTDIDNYILAKTIIGAQTETSASLLGFINFSASVLGFVVLILVPCILMLVFYIINISSKAVYEKEEKELKKKLILDKEIVKEQDNIKPEKNSVINQFESETDLAKKVEGYEAKIDKNKEKKSTSASQILNNTQSTNSISDKQTISSTQSSIPPKPPAKPKPPVKPKTTGTTKTSSKDAPKTKTTNSNKKPKKETSSSTTSIPPKPPKSSIPPKPPKN